MAAVSGTAMIVPMRITIIGHAGGGKSRLATRISKKFNIPHLHLDTFWFEARGHHTKGKVAREADRPRVEKYVEEKVLHFIAQDSWVSDGWFGHVQPTIAARADQIVFMDMPLLRRLWNQLYRAVFGKRRHPDITFFDDMKFISQINLYFFLHLDLVLKLRPFFFIDFFKFWIIIF